MLVMVSVALSAAAIEGVKATGIVQDALTNPVQVFATTEKSAAFGPEISALVKVAGFPVTVSATDNCELEVSGTLPKVRLVGLAKREPAAPLSEKLQIFAVSGVASALMPLRYPRLAHVAVFRNVYPEAINTFCGELSDSE